MVRVKIPGDPDRTGYRAPADVTDAESGQTLPCRSIDIHVDAATMRPMLKMELIDFEAAIAGTWECKLIDEKPL